MANQYYYLIAGLPDIALDNAKQQLSPLQLREELYANISDKNLELIKIHYFKYDNQNVLNLLEKKEKPFNNLGIFPQGQVEEEIGRVKDEGVKSDHNFPVYLQEFIYEYLNEILDSSSLSAENVLAEKYFSYAMQSSNQFICEYYKFEMHMLNLLTAFFSRKHKVEYENEILGDDEISNLIRKSNARDFNVSGEFEFAPALLQIAETSDIIEREKKMDALRWNYLDDCTFFNYFTIERVFAYIAKLEILDRWLSISPEKGKNDFENILSELQSGYEFPE